MPRAAREADDIAGSTQGKKRGERRGIVWSALRGVRRLIGGIFAGIGLIWVISLSGVIGFAAYDGAQVEPASSISNASAPLSESTASVTLHDTLNSTSSSALSSALSSAESRSQRSVNPRPRADAIADAIVVLGAAQYDGRPSPVLRARLDHAITLWRDNTAPYLVFTGGMGSGDTTSEAKVSGVYARHQGVPDSVVLLETKGRTTRESMHAVAAMLHERDMTSVILVSDPFHMFRLWMLAHRIGLDPRTSPTRTSPISPTSIKNVGYIFTESLKAPIAFILG